MLHLNISTDEMMLQIHVQTQETADFVLIDAKLLEGLMCRKMYKEQHMQYQSVVAVCGAGAK